MIEMFFEVEEIDDEGDFEAGDPNVESNPVDPREAPKAAMHRVDPGFFDVFGLEVLQGRAIEARDVAGDLVGQLHLLEALTDLLGNLTKEEEGTGSGNLQQLQYPKLFRYNFLRQSFLFQAFH